jgi:cold shock CspA family protein
MPDKERGVLTKWDDAKGFGFIKPSNSAGTEIFIHISEIRRMSRRPL